MGHQQCAICWFINSPLSPVSSNSYAHFTNGQVAMACAVCSGNSTCWSLKLPTPLLSGEIQAQKSHLCKFAQLLGCRPAGPCFPHPLFSARFNRNGRRAISRLLGGEKKAGPGRRNAQDGPGEGQRAWEGRQGLEPKANTTLSSWCLGHSWLSCIWVQGRKLGLRAAEKLFKILSWRKSSALSLKPPRGSVPH